MRLTGSILTILLSWKKNLSDVKQQIYMEMGNHQRVLILLLLY